MERIKIIVIVLLMSVLTVTMCLYKYSTSTRKRLDNYVERTWFEWKMVYYEAKERYYRDKYVTWKEES